MTKFTVLFFFLLCMCTVASLQAQDKKQPRENLVEEDPLPPDTGSKPKFVPRVGEKFDVVLNYGLPSSGAPAVAPMNNLGSSTVSLWFSFNKVLNERLAVKAMPGLTWTTLNFSVAQSTPRQFPTPDTALSPVRTPYTSDIFRLFYFELPLAVTLTAQRDAKQRPIVFFDIGASIGYRPFAASYERTYDTSTLTVAERFEPVPNVSRWRGTAFVRVVYRFIGLQLQYRFIDVFFNDAGYGANASKGGANGYPKLPPIELGVSIVL